ncbi:MAG: DUF6104 family protein [Candidatus Nanopelagicales bacterium]
MYDSDRGIDELLDRRADEDVSIEWLADRMRVFVDLHPGWEDAVGRLAVFLARQGDDD